MLYSPTEGVIKMKIDLYTKVVLTIIAVSLVLLTSKLLFSPREAIAERIQSVWVKNNPLFVDISPDRLIPIPVHITNPQDFFENESKEFPWQMTEPSELP